MSAVVRFEIRLGGGGGICCQVVGIAEFVDGEYEYVVLILVEPSFAPSVRAAITATASSAAAAAANATIFRGTGSVRTLCIVPSKACLEKCS